MAEARALGWVLRRLPGTHVVLEPRARRHKFGALNYGEVDSTWINAADGDPWDVFAPGLSCELRAPYRARVHRVLGHIRLRNGNHKIAVTLHRDDLPSGVRVDPRRGRAEIERYRCTYAARMNMDAQWVAHDDRRLGADAERRRTRGEKKSPRHADDPGRRGRATHGERHASKNGRAHVPHAGHPTPSQR